MSEGYAARIRELRATAVTLRAQAGAGGGIVSYQFNGKAMQKERIKDLLAAARECDAEADDLENRMNGGFFGSTSLVYRRY